MLNSNSQCFYPSTPNGQVNYGTAQDDWGRGLTPPAALLKCLQVSQFFQTQLCKFCIPCHNISSNTIRRKQTTIKSSLPERGASIALQHHALPILAAHPREAVPHHRLGWNSRRRTSAPRALLQPHRDVPSRSFTLSQPSSPNFKTRASSSLTGLLGQREVKRHLKAVGEQESLNLSTDANLVGRKS